MTSSWTELPESAAPEASTREASWRSPTRPFTSILDLETFNTPGEAAVRRKVRDFAAANIVPVADDIEHSGVIERELFDRISNAGILSLTVASEYGGGGATAGEGCVAVEELGRASGAVAAATCVQVCGGLYPRLFPEESLRRRLYTSFVNGGLLAIGATEQQAGTDVGGYAMSATRTGHGWRLNGTKYFVTNGGLAATYFVFARTDDGQLSAFLIDADRCPVDVRPLNLVGWRGARVAEVTFNDVEAREDDLVGEPGTALDLLQRVFTAGRLYNAALSLGIGRSALDYAAAYAEERVSGGKPLNRHQSLQFVLTDALTELMELRILMGTVSAMWDKASHESSFDPGVLAATAMVKMRSTRASRTATEAAMYVVGARAFEADSIATRHQRDAAALIYTEGTDAVQRKVIWRASQDPAVFS